jgi:hypothetical protein
MKYLILTLFALLIQNELNCQTFYTSHNSIDSRYLIHYQLHFDGEFCLVFEQYNYEYDESLFITGKYEISNDTLYLYEDENIDIQISVETYLYEDDSFEVGDIQILTPIKELIYGHYVPVQYKPVEYTLNDSIHLIATKGDELNQVIMKRDGVQNLWLEIQHEFNVQKKFYIEPKASNNTFLIVYHIMSRMYELKHQIKNVPSIITLNGKQLYVKYFIQSEGDATD